MDPETIRAIAELARKRSVRSCEVSHGDGMSRLGASRALNQLARDLEVSADALEHSPRRKR